MLNFFFRKSFKLPVPFIMHLDNPVMAKFPIWEIIYLVNSVPHKMAYKAEFLHTAVHYLQFELKIHPTDLVSISKKV